ncbi:IucA/IucC family protein [Actinocorallia sp. B10E7]|uniref:IucA/IucC family protein n=1 Tax=Actinocorallia sp. B10E7 TaxID=3153558 RepID=UPI00325F21B8
MPLTSTGPSGGTGLAELHSVEPADEATAVALLNCLVREVSGPAGRVRDEGDRLAIDLAHTTVTARLARPSHGPSPRLAGPFTAGGADLGWRELADLVAAELAGRTGADNPEFLQQVVSSHEAMCVFHRSDRPDPGIRPLLASEQSLRTGHRFHPSPKSRQGAPGAWLPYAPEAGARFPLRLLGVDPGFLAGSGDFSALAEPGVLPVHPWQWRLLRERPLLREALSRGMLRDLGEGEEVVPTSSVRTVFVPASGVFAKFSLDVRITNCVRKNSWYELAAAPVLTGLLKPLLGDALLGEPAYRTVTLADRALYEGLGVILREGAPEESVLAAALADPCGRFLPDGLDPVVYWEAYVRAVALPVLRLFFEHGVVLEPHLQNVLIVPGPDGVPVRAIFRDLEGTKLLPGWKLDGLPPRVRESVTYDEERGWNRVAYCLLVNHLAEIAAALADREPDCEPVLWKTAARLLEQFAGHRRMREVLDGAPLPAKANLLARWNRSADRAADYVTVSNPLVG